MTLSHILCPIDFSEASTHALEQAVVLAQSSGARITALHVFLAMLPPTELTTLDAATGDVVDPADVQRWRDRAAAQCRAVHAPGVDLDVIVIGGQPVATILHHAEALPADLIVIGTHGAAGFQHLMLGSVTEKVLRKAACPVLTVPPRVKAAAAAFANVMCAVDFSDCSLNAVTAAAALARESGARLTLLHVIEWPWHEPPVPMMEGVPAAQAQALIDYRRYLETGATERLKDVAASAAADREVEMKVCFGKPYVETLAAAAETQADLIVLGVRGRNALDLGFFGSTANHVVRAATCPVLTIRA